MYDIFEYDVYDRHPNYDNDQDEEAMFKHFSTYDQDNNCFNGIAYLPQDDTFLVTGKMWNHIYKVKLDY